MKKELYAVTKVILTMDQEEVEWLHRVMQNPLYNQTPEQETGEDRAMRQKFWEATAIWA